MNKEYVLVTGATGFIGSHVTEKLLSDQSYEVVTIVRNTKNYKNVEELENKGAILAKGNFYDRNFLEELFEKFPIRNVIHIAALRGGGVGTWNDYYKVNVKGTQALLEVAFNHQIKRFIFCSSVGVFGTIPEALPANLSTHLVGDNDYHNSKILAEKKVHEFINKGLDACIVRPTITYGPGDDGFPMTLVKMVKKRIFLLPQKDIKIHLLDVFSFAGLLSQIVKSHNLKQRVFIAADESPVSLKELVELIHYHYYKTNYPYILRIPRLLFEILAKTFQLTGNKKWLTRILLISNSWHYDISDTISKFQYLPTRTLDSFKKNMCV